MKISDLPEREREIAMALVKGYEPTEIAAMRGVSIKTVRSQRINLFERLGIRNDLQLFAMALLEARGKPRLVEQMIEEVLP